ELGKVFFRLSKKHIEVNVSNPAKEFLAEKGYDPNLGARPLKRVIQKEMLDPLSLKIVSGEIIDGDKVTADVKANCLKFQILTRKEKKSKKI
ncbi:MAG: hypothetical protein GW876_03005, partial [Bacteroidetes bacterium]|nr:hypothetical protein [Bacteroidota bacterium]